MKKFFLLAIAVLALATCPVRGQYIWKSTDTYQIWERLDSICPTSAMAFYTHYPWKNTDLYQIWLKLDSCFGSGGGGGSDSLAWHITGNSGTTTANFFGTADSVDVRIKTNNILRGLIKASAGQLWFMSGYDTLTYTGSNSVPPPIVTNNIFIGDSTAYQQTMTLTDTLKAVNCIGIGRNAMRDNKYVHNAVAIGIASQMSDEGATAINYPSSLPYSENVSVGNFSLMYGNTGTPGEQFFENTAMGYAAGQYCHSKRNVFIGTAAGQLDSATTGELNTYVGAFAGQQCGGGSSNSYFGFGAGNGVGADAVACVYIGAFAGGNTGTTFRNVYIGKDAGFGCVNDNDQVLIGQDAGRGANAGHNTICLGRAAGALGSFQKAIYIGPFAYADVTKQDNTTPIHCYNLSATDSSVQNIDLNGNVSTLSVNDKRKKIDSSAGDSGTSDGFYGSFVKDNSGTTYTLTNGLITSNSIIVPGWGTTGITSVAKIIVVPGAGSAVFTFEDAAGTATAPNANCIVTYHIGN